MFRVDIDVLFMLEYARLSLILKFELFNRFKV